MTVLDELAFMEWLKEECGYLDPRPIGGGRYACVMPLIYTAAIITGKIFNRHSTEDRCCYHSIEVARAALDAWDGTGEPSGWHRHPGSGRRRTGGDPATEYPHD